MYRSGMNPEENGHDPPAIPAGCAAGVGSTHRRSWPASAYNPANRHGFRGGNRDRAANQPVVTSGPMPMLHSIAMAASTATSITSPTASTALANRKPRSLLTLIITGTPE